jgi:hypothetical protein
LVHQNGAGNSAVLIGAFASGHEARAYVSFLR